MIGNSDCAAGSFGASYGDVLVEGRRTLNGRLIDTRVLPDRVAWSVTGDTAFHRAAGGKGKVIFYDVVFDKGVGAPAVNRKQANSATNTKIAAKLDRAIESVVLVKGCEWKSNYSYEGLPVLHPTPTTKSLGLDQLTANPVFECV